MTMGWRDVVLHETVAGVSLSNSSNSQKTCWTDKTVAGVGLSNISNSSNTKTGKGKPEAEIASHCPVEPEDVAVADIDDLPPWSEICPGYWQFCLHGCEHFDAKHLHFCRKYGRDGRLLQ
jgi:hypothetical protein